MFNLKRIKKTLLILSLIVFTISTLITVIVAFNNPNGYLASILGVQPVVIETNGSITRANYGKEINIEKNSIIKFGTTQIYSTQGSLIPTSSDSIILDGVFYLNNNVKKNLELDGNLKLSLEKGEYIIDTNPTKIFIFSGKLLQNNNSIASSNQVASLVVDKFRTQEIAESDLETRYIELLDFLQDNNILPVVTPVSETFVPVSEELDSQPQISCDSALLVPYLLCNINKHREDKNLQALELDESLNQLALSHSVWMEENQSTTSVQSNGLSFKERCSNLNLDCIDEINLKLTSFNLNEILEQVIMNKEIESVDASRIGINASGEYISILLM